MSWYKKAKKREDHLHGGNADKKKPEDFDQKELEIGKKVEFEHTNDPDITKEIAMDHLIEHPDYYIGLKHMEEELKDIEKKRDIKEARGEPRYPGQLQGDEYRPGDVTMIDIIRDNELVEGKHVRNLRELYKEKNWAGFNEYASKLKEEGHSPNRINSMITRSMHGIRL